MTIALIRFILLISMFMYSLSISAQNEIAFTNRVSFVLTGNASINRFVALIPAPVTNEYQEINSLKANCGTFIDINEANKVLFYDGAFKRPTFDIYESFYYKTRKVKIDFSNKSNKNIVTQTDPNDYLDSDGVYINTNNKTIKEIGDRIWNVSSNTLDYAKRCYFEQVGDGSNFLPTAKRIFGEYFKAFQIHHSDADNREVERREVLKAFVRDHGLSVTMYQDYGWPAKDLRL